MRFSFERNVSAYSEIAKDRAKAKREQNSDELHELQSVLDWHIQRSASNRQTSIEVQKQIFAIQEQKQEIMAILRRDLRLIDHDPEKIDWGDNALMVEDREGVLHVPAGTYGSIHLSEDTPVSPGEIVTDQVWGLTYALGKDAPRATKKHYLIERARSAIGKLLDEQIALDEQSSATTSDMLRMVYEKKAETEKGPMVQSGFIAEHMVKNFLQKISIDSSADFQIIQADIYQDVTQKIDFIIHRKTHVRGVDVEVTDKDDIGVQFTINTSAKKLAHKQDQLRKAKKFLANNRHAPIDDYALVSIPLQDVNQLYAEWQKNRHPGGPDKLWGQKVKRHIFREVLKGIFTPAEIDAQEAKIFRGTLAQAA